MWTGTEQVRRNGKTSADDNSHGEGEEEEEGTLEMANGLDR